VPAILVGAVTAAAARTAVETPFELAKVRWMCGGSVAADGRAVSFSAAQIRELYVGVGPTFYRAAVMLGSFFCFVDVAERAAPDLCALPLLGGFLKGGVCATAAWAIAWPLEVCKSIVQGGGAKSPTTTGAVLASILRRSGPAGLWRGFLPGAMRSLVSNGTGMAVYQLMQDRR